MDNQFKYYDYLSKDSKFYVKPKSTHVPDFIVEGLSSDWLVSKNDPFWAMYHAPETEMPIQGFKIHVSTEFKNAENTLNIVSKVLVERNISFKHIKNIPLLFYMYSKTSSRVQAGKFITIYPMEEDFVSLIHELAQVLEKEPRGPYILTDKRWQKSNVFYRYGAFTGITDENGISCIQAPDGKLIPDAREPRFALPSFVKLPDVIKNSEETFVATLPKAESPLKSYSIEKALRFSNAGGIYLATRKSDGLKCVIKEARASVGLDGTNKTAEERLNTEYHALKKLKGIQGVVQIVDYFKVWENTFLVIEYVEGVPLYSWVASNFPFSTDDDTTKYLEKATRVIKNIENAVVAMHQVGMAMCDLNFQNVLIDDNEKAVLIDFEVADATESSDISGLGTPGFTHILNTTAREKDWYAFNRLLHFMLIPVSAVYDLDMKLNTEHCLWIFSTFGEDGFNVYKEFFCKTKSALSNYNDIFQGSYENATDILQVSSYVHVDKVDEHDMFTKLKNALFLNCDPNSNSYINGDIRQNEMDCGQLNLQNGGFGAILTRLRLEEVDQGLHIWIRNQIPTLLSKSYNNGLMTGRSGIACVLYECGYIKESVEMFDIVINSIDTDSQDLTLRSGLAGIGISLCCIAKAENNPYYLETAEKIAIILRDKVNDNDATGGTDWQSYDIGLLDGYTGISLFFTILYSVTKNEKYIEISEMIIDAELWKAKYIDKHGTLQLMDFRTTRAYPYLSTGSVGLGIAIEAYNLVNQTTAFEDEMNSIKGVCSGRITLEPGFFDGLGGFFLMNCLQNEIDAVTDTLSKLKLFLIEENECLYVPGRLSLKFSSDLHTGVAGVLMGLLTARSNNPLLWLPMTDYII